MNSTHLQTFHLNNLLDLTKILRLNLKIFLNKKATLIISVFGFCQGIGCSPGIQCHSLLRFPKALKVLWMS